MSKRRIGRPLSIVGLPLPISRQILVYPCNLGMLWRIMRLTIQSKLFLSHFAAIVLISGSVGTYFYQSAIENLEQALRSRLQNSAALVSHGFNIPDLDRIRTIQLDSWRQTYAGVLPPDWLNWLFFRVAPTSEICSSRYEISSSI